MHQIVIEDEQRVKKRSYNWKNESSIDPVTGEVKKQQQRRPLSQNFISKHFVKVLDTDLKGNKIKFTCQHCQAQFWVKNLCGLYAEPLKAHMFSAHSIEYQLDEKIISSTSTTDPITGEHKIFKPKDYDRKGVVWRYFKDHPDNRPLNHNKKFVCQICGKSSGYTSMARHILNHGVVANEPASCSICGKTFKNFVRRDKHERRHKEEKKIFCQVCSKGFKNAQQLGRHMLIHTGEKPYQVSRWLQLVKKRDL